MIHEQTTIDTITQLIQVSVAPVFLIAGVAGLLNVFTGRLARIIDRLEKLDNSLVKAEQENPNFKMSEAQEKRRKFLVRRMQNINRAIFFGTTTGFTIALVILSIFASSLMNFDSNFVISVLFICSMISLIIALLLFLREIHDTTSFIKGKSHNIKLK